MQRRRGVRSSQRIANRKENDAKVANDGDNAMDVQKGVQIETAETQGKERNTFYIFC